jgi:uncharacterized membrane protein YbhN (UPF0104 family)
MMLMFHSEMRPSTRPERNRRWLWIAASSTVGLLAVFWIVRQAGFDATRAILARALPLLPWVLALEACRIATEVLAARDLFALLRGQVPTGALVKAQLAGYAICNVFPIGRTASEAATAGLLKSHASLPKTAAVAAIAQALHLIASAVILVPAVVAARSTASSFGLSLTILGQCVLLGAVGATLLLVAYFAPFGSSAFRRLPKVGAALEQFSTAMRQLPRFPISALAWLVVNRALQVAIIAILLRAVGASGSLAGALVAEAVLLIGASAGDFIPGQIGALEGAFAFFAAAIGTTPQTGVAVALLIHLVQAAWVVAGFVALGFGRAKRPAIAAPPLLQTPFTARLEGTRAFRAS